MLLMQNQNCKTQTMKNSFCRLHCTG